MYSKKEREEIIEDARRGLARATLQRLSHIRGGLCDSLTSTASKKSGDFIKNAGPAEQLLSDHSQLNHPSDSVAKSNNERLSVPGLSSALLRSGGTEDMAKRAPMVIKSNGPISPKLDPQSAFVRDPKNPRSTNDSLGQGDDTYWWNIIRDQAGMEHVDLALGPGGELLYSGSPSEKLRTWLILHRSAVVNGRRTNATPWVAV